MERNRPTLLRIFDVLSRTHLPAPDSDDRSPDDVVEDRPIYARLHGIITAIRRAGATRRFFDLVDPTGSVQLAAIESEIGEHGWEGVRSVSKGDRVYVEGVVTNDSRGQP